MNTLEQLRNVALKANLPTRDVHQLVNVFANMGDTDRKNLLELLEENPEWVKKLSSAISKKSKALETGNLEAWNKYIDSEEQALSEIIKNE